MNVECDSPAALARCAYHLGSRHVPVEVGDGWLRIAADHELEHVLQGLGARLTPMEAPFEPEVGTATSVSTTRRATRTIGMSTDTTTATITIMITTHDHDHAHCDHPHHHQHRDK